MVNIKKTGISTKAYMLSRLRGAEGKPVSGELMAGELGISRVAVWKAGKGLKEAGYAVDVDERGYFIDAAAADDLLYPWEFGEQERFFHHWTRTDSTMNRAAELAARGGLSGSVMVAETQSAGRGRSGRKWSSASGGLFFTLLERPCLAAADYARVSMAAGIAVCRALRDICGTEIRLRWPNDVYVRDRKIAGILSEVRSEGDRVIWMSLGIGVNVNNKSVPANSASCAALCGKRLSRREVLSRILREFDRIRPFVPHSAELEKQWNGLAEGIGGKVLLIDPLHGPSERDIPGCIMGRGSFLGSDSQGFGIVRSSRGPSRISPGAASLRFI